MNYFTIKKVLFIFLLLIIFSFSLFSKNNGSNIETNILNSIEIIKNTDDSVEIFNAINNLHSYDVKVIPYLINEIDNTADCHISLFHPENSTFPPLYNQYLGSIFAYIIELILSKKELIDNAAKYDDPLGGKNYIYMKGVLRNLYQSVKDNKITISDMNKIKAIYESWWTDNERKSIRKLRKDWKKEKKYSLNTIFLKKYPYPKRPLFGSDYYWR